MSGATASGHNWQEWRNRSNHPARRWPADHNLQKHGRRRRRGAAAAGQAAVVRRASSNANWSSRRRCGTPKNVLRMRPSTTSFYVYQISKKRFFLIWRKF